MELARNLLTDFHLKEPQASLQTPKVLPNFNNLKFTGVSVQEQFK